MSRAGSTITLTEQKHSRPGNVHDDLSSIHLDLYRLAPHAGERGGSRRVAGLPTEVSLKTSKDRQSVVVQALYADGITRDVTDEVQWSLADDKIAAREANVLRAAGDGQTQLSVAFGGQSVQIPVAVTEAEAERSVSFKLDVMPIFMKSGCNTGSCHGAARGKDGFRLSLFGFDPDGDHYRITREQPGRRIDLAVPEASLIVEKSVGAVPHTGGKRFELDSAPGRDLVEWIASGVPADAEDVPACTSIELYPVQAVLDGEGATQHVTVLARYSDGTYPRRDVAGPAAVEQFGQCGDLARRCGDGRCPGRSLRDGPLRHAHGRCRSTSSSRRGSQYEPQPFEPVNYIDELVAAKLKRLRIHPSEQCGG